MSSKWRSAFVPHDIKTPLTGASSGPLAGLTVAVKDMYDIAGERVSGGSPAWLAEQAPARKNSTVVDQILAAGGTITGKTVCDEFFYSISGTNVHYGTPLNPRAPDRIPGGSSSGSASACSSGACDIAIGSDTGGSVRVPAALCGIYGIRTSRGRMNLQGVMAMAPSFDAGGWFAASPGVLGRVGPVLLANWDDSDRHVERLSILKDAFGHTEENVRDLCRGFLEAARVELPPTTVVDVAADKIDHWREAMRVTQAHEVWQTFGPFISGRDRNIAPDIAERMRIASKVDAAEVRECRAVLAEATDRLEQATAGRTVLVLPTCPSIAPRLQSSPKEFEQFRVNTMRLVCMASISGLPQVTIPIGTVDDAPVGLSFLGWRNGEEALLELAKRVARFVGAARR